MDDKHTGRGQEDEWFLADADDGTMERAVEPMAAMVVGLLRRVGLTPDDFDDSTWAELIGAYVGLMFGRAGAERRLAAVLKDARRKKRRRGQEG